MWRRTPGVAGAFYPSDTAKLKHDIETYMENVDYDEKLENLTGIISPHAGYVFSGQVAAYSYAQLKDSGYEIAVVLAPSHRARFDGASVIPEGVYETPLGDVEVDDEIGNRLVKMPGFSFVKEVHQYEHSLEVQVPFLQVVCENIKIVPVIIGCTDLDTCRSIGKLLAEILETEKRKWIIVISTDLSHYHNYEDARSIDAVFIDALTTFDENSVYSTLLSRKAQACGEGPVLTGMAASRQLGASEVKILKYANSGDTAGPRDQVVGYLSAAFIK
jgi:MEMO1 family protein